MSRTYAILQVTQATWDEIHAGLKEAQIYDHQIDETEGIIDMHGIALRVWPEEDEGRPDPDPSQADLFIDEDAFRAL